MFKEILKSIVWGVLLLFTSVILILNLYLIFIFYEKFIPNDLQSNVDETISIIKPKIEYLMDKSKKSDNEKITKLTRLDILKDVNKYCSKCIIPTGYYPYEFYDFENIIGYLEKNKDRENINFYNKVNFISFGTLTINTLILIYAMTSIFIYKNSMRSYLSLIILFLPIITLTYGISLFKVNNYFEFKIPDQSSSFLLFTIAYLFVAIPALFTYLKRSDMDIHKLILLKK
jgi:hypothetical protein